jgi:putative ATP-dependent endonuclease of OLD family
VSLKEDDQIVFKGSCFVTFQRPVMVFVEKTEYRAHGRTFEEAFVLENLLLFQNGTLPFSEDLSQLNDFDSIKSTIYSEVRSADFKKTEFALVIASQSTDWKTPEYIECGLRWLEAKLIPKGDNNAPLGSQNGVS